MDGSSHERVMRINSTPNSDLVLCFRPAGLTLAFFRPQKTSGIRQTENSVGYPRQPNGNPYDYKADAVPDRLARLGGIAVMLNACTGNLLAHVIVQSVVQGLLNLRRPRQQDIDDHTEHLKGHLIRRPLGPCQESIDTDEMLRFMEPNAENHTAHRMTSHGQYPPGDQDGEVPQTRGGEAIEKMKLVNLKGLWQIPLGYWRSSGPTCFSQKGYGRNASAFQLNSAASPSSTWENGKTIVL